ncbi:MAG: tRNA (N(6)-L-threonylcarbamoyladenosine(37)-C(2))-methylthiotransferase MtaB [Candidatus Omnitrophica bacterium]|nr:tRNA (N(6)-L-threonylcarbamoyladenosine(37)-C(2))-methylthiotransferase MtaB [Candidatus Omnitrophota bacterium]
MPRRVPSKVEARGRTIKFFTLGCKVNQYDTQAMRERFIRAGFRDIKNGKKSDIYVINTCTVTQGADRESRYLIRYVRRNNPQAAIAVTGCYAQSDSDEIKKIPGVTYVVKNDEKNRIIELLSKEQHYKEINWHNGLGKISNFPGHTRAFLKIQDGCSNFCSYCKVPLVRGSPRSKPLKNIIQEAEQLVRKGFKEIVLCGICLGQYGRDLDSRINLVNVLEALEDLTGLLRVRLSSIEAGDVSDQLINMISRSNPTCRPKGKLCRHLHIPIQSGDDAILEKMNRNYCRKDYLKLIRKIKKYIPEVAITTDVLVGFPGESDKAFENSVNLVKKISPLKVHIFPFSPREGTLAFGFKDRISQEIIKKRMLRLSNIAESLSLSYRKKFLNKNMDVLIEQRNKKSRLFWSGHTDNYIEVIVKSSTNLKNQMMSLRLGRIFEDCVIANFS